MKLSKCYEIITRGALFNRRPEKHLSEEMLNEES